MRQAFCRGLIEFAEDPQFAFLTGDLGFAALETLRECMGPRFLNAGISEQNMISVAAGLAKSGLRPWVYSIAPFLYARAFEQIRNDVSLHGLPVTLVGNGGGYGYGVMGSTHHALEDYGVLLTLPNMRVYVPAFDSDVTEAIGILMRASHPGYLRLGLSEQPAGFEPVPFAPWRRAVPGRGVTVAIMGALAGGVIGAILSAGLTADVWLVSELPAPPPAEFLESVRNASLLMAIEEHAAVGGLGDAVSRYLLCAGVAPRRFIHRCAAGYASGLYGSQQFHRRECGIDGASIVAALREAAAA
jgi:transketolase